MASYTVASGQVGAHGKTLVASTVDTVTFTGEDPPDVTVISDGAAAVFYTVDGSTPTVNGANCYLLPAGVVSSDRRLIPTAAPAVVKLISSGTPTYSVQREP
jgi:hypothetical protein